MNPTKPGKRNLATALLLAGLLAGSLPVRAGADELWEAVFQLGHPDEATREAAAQTLRAAGPAGFQVTLLATRTLDAAALPSLARELGCIMLAFDGGPVWSPPESAMAVGHAAARLLAEFVQEEPELALELARSAVPAERKIGLLGLTCDAPKLLEVLEELRDETDPGVVEYARRIIPCATIKAHGDEQLILALTQASLAARARREEMLPPVRCEEAGFSVGPVLDGLIAGTTRASGWQRENSQLSIQVRMADGVRVLLSPRCAFELYDAARRQERYLPGLVMPFVEELTLDPRDRQEAMRRAERDVVFFPEDDRNYEAARLVNAGGKSAHLVTFNAEDPFAQELYLEAAARQGQARAWQVIEQAAFCRGDFGDGERIELLGFVGTSEAAETAAELARRCPRARGAATVALIRLGDRRAADYLAAALEDPGFASNSLERALSEHLTQPLTRALLQAAARGGIGSLDAQQILERLRAAGKVK
jgi:hypothetical protein